MKRWEYKMLRDEDAFIHKLDEMGGKGWELVCILVEKRYRRYDDERMWVFKREIDTRQEL